ncbi:flp pilus-assembly TadE/G-like family protein [Skermania sp. ID1734]|uniref:Rv3654c family TadE-like protein n=1 Tax=Skermania sp. ID1734 TaxID=2597516 RepID=UPI00117C34FC|nr:Rv3654c family TadE-like protein [Skermania sp. ID1734]TSE00582.1 flp pilus-assembly TadE/G-like family protein [Skermania sp. ID1734]
MKGRDDAGFATVFAALAMLGLLAVTVLVVQFGAVVAARHRAQSAADLAALAAAGALVDGTADACRRATAIADRMGVHTRSCVVADWDAVVTVDTAVAFAAFGTRQVQAVARAGPVSE